MLWVFRWSFGMWQCVVISGNQLFRRTWLSLHIHDRKCRQQIPMKCWQLATRLYGNTFQKTLFLTVILHCTIDIIQLVQLLSVESNSTCTWSRSFSLHKIDSRRARPLVKYNLVELITETKLQHNNSNAILLKFHVQCEPETFYGFWNNTLRQGGNISLTLIRHMPSPWEFMLTIRVYIWYFAGDHRVS